MITQLTLFDIHLLPSSDIVPDPEHPGQYLMRCSVCCKWRTVKKKPSKSRICRSCTLQRRNRKRRKSIENSEVCIIHEQFHHPIPSCSEGNWYALVECPFCHRVFAKRRSAIFRSHQTYCLSCVHSISQLKPLATSKNCKVIKPHLFGYKYATALVECPVCHGHFEKTRGNIRRDNHTICFPCASHLANSGSNHYLWRGGKSNNYYYGYDWVYLSACIRARDNYRCQYSGCFETRHTQNRALSVHHIVPFNESRDNNPRNLISLCQTHHLWADNNLRESIPMFDNIIQFVYGPDY